jgi:uncharacterized membrane protein YgdD (TMEM256/DUF423 family)
MTKRSSTSLISCGAVTAALGVGLGAFGAHGLKTIVPPDHLAIFETAVRYQMYHSLGMMIVGIVPQMVPSVPLRRWMLTGWLFAAGILLFSGSLYLLVLLNIPWMGAITPLGGISFIAGWLLLGWEIWKARKSS